MTIKTRIITGSVKSVRCDKCGQKVTHFFTRVCNSCYSHGIANKRISDFIHRYCVIGSWQDHYDKCRLCGEYLEKQSSVELCDSCVNSLHPDSSHRASGTGPGWGYEKPSRDSAYHCGSCGGVQIIEVGEGPLQYSYYKVGSKIRLRQPYICPSNAIENLVARSKCIHEYIAVLNTAIDNARKRNAQRQYRKLCKEDNLGWLVEDAQDIYERQAYGETHLWCWKCGAYYVPTGKPSFIPPAVSWGEETS